MYVEHDVEWVIASLKRRYNATTDEELATALRISRKTVSSWRTRGSVPVMVLAQAQLSQGAIFDSLLSENGLRSEQVELVSKAIFLFLRDRYRDLPQHDTRHDALVYWAETLPSIETKLKRHLLEMPLDGLNAYSALELLIQRIERGEIFTASETLDWPETQ